MTGEATIHLRARSNPIRERWKRGGGKQHPNERTGIKIARKLRKLLKGLTVTVSRPSFSTVTIHYQTKETA